MTRKRIDYLHERYTSGQATDDELDELKSLLTDPRHESDVLDWLDSAWEHLDDKSLLDIPVVRKQAILDRIVERDTGRRWIRRLVIWSAAAVMIISSTLLYQYWIPKNKSVETIILTQADMNDVEPGTDKAVLTLSDGRQVILDGKGAGQILAEPSLQISKTAGGMLVYLPSGVPMPGAELKYNTLSTPVGGQYQVMLPDGTKVSLNASSRLKYPQRFLQGERYVEFEGEAYFEVATDPSRPFIVKTTTRGVEQEVRVLGTEFNINSYDHGDAVVTTVVGGRVAVRGENVGEVLLGLGQQSVLQDKGNTVPTLHMQTADITKVLAWKDGLFVFDNEPLPDLLKRVSRWYDVEFVYEEGLGDVLFQGNYFRNKGLLNLLINLEATDRIQFRIDQTYQDERRIYVMKK